MNIDWKVSKYHPLFDKGHGDYKDKILAYITYGKEMQIIWELKVTMLFKLEMRTKARRTLKATVGYNRQGQLHQLQKPQTSRQVEEDLGRHTKEEKIRRD